MRKEESPVVRAISALDWILQNPSLETGVRELAAGLRVSPSSAHRLLLALSDASFVSKNVQTSKYALSAELFRLTRLARSKSPIQRIAHDPMHLVSKTCGETVVLGVYHPVRRQMMFSAAICSVHPAQCLDELNKWSNMHVGASSLAIMAHLNESALRAIVECMTLASSTDPSRSELGRLLVELRRVRAQGVSVTRGRRQPGVVELAAPIFASEGRVFGDVCLFVDEDRFGKTDEEAAARLLIQCACKISKDLVGSTTPDRRE